ncbi:MAG: response regulator transcription factor [Acidobacteria bacterium]|nr:response regulator transcription factor [Acidobacteriota bacterium]
MKNLRAVIVDDEDLARQDLKNQLSNFPQIIVVGEANSVETAVEIINNIEPDVVFLDIQMPKESGFKLFEKIPVDFPVVFVTAFDNYAIRAFEVNALDYLLKPVNRNRLAQTITRLEKQEKPEFDNKLKLDYQDFIFIKCQGRTGFVKISSIIYICAIGDYTEIHINKGEKKLVLKPLCEWEQNLPNKHFFRIHRSQIINIDYVDRVEPGFKSTYQIYLKNIVEPLSTSRKYSTELRKRFF